MSYIYVPVLSIKKKKKSKRIQLYTNFTYEGMHELDFFGLFRKNSKEVNSQK